MEILESTTVGVHSSRAAFKVLEDGARDEVIAYFQRNELVITALIQSYYKSNIVEFPELQNIQNVEAKLSSYLTEVEHEHEELWVISLKRFLLLELLKLVLNRQIQAAELIRKITDLQVIVYNYSCHILIDMFDVYNEFFNFSPEVK